MPGFGYGFGFRKAERRGKLGPRYLDPVLPQAIEPDAQWDGSPGSGFSTTPSDPTRVTAKPAMRLLVPPDQFFTDELVVGVLAGANDNGSLFSNMGLSHIRLHFEGAELDIAAPSHAAITDANGNRRIYFGWWATLKKPTGKTGECQLYFEAVPTDPTMQRRVIGPYSFHATEQLHDFSLEVASSQQEIAGQRYQSLSGALTYLRQQGAENPLVEISEGGSYALGNSSGIYGGRGYCTITATAPVSIVNPPTIASFVAFRPNYNGLRFRGSNLTIDFAQAHAIYHEATGPARQHWFDGCNLINSNGRESLLRNAPSDAMGYLAGGKPILTECYTTEVARVGQNASLVRGCTIERSWNDLFNGGACVVHNEIMDHDSRWFRDDHLAMTLTYSGPASDATIESSGNRTFTAKEDGVEIGSFSLGFSHSDWLAGTNFLVSNVVDWVNNDLPNGWSATLADNAHRGIQLSTSGGLGKAFSNPVSVKDVTVNLYSSWDLHADVYQKQNTAGFEENLLFAFNKGVGISAQDIFLAGTPGIKDMLVLNNAFANFEPVTDRSQLSATHNHVVIAHNSFSTQPFLIRNDVSYAGDSYCLFSNNVAPEISLEGGLTTELSFANNHVQSASSKTPAGTSEGGTKDTLFADAATGNFTPKGALLANQRSSSLAIDLNGFLRKAISPAGALA